MFQCDSFGGRGFPKLDLSTEGLKHVGIIFIDIVERKNQNDKIHTADES